MLFPKRTVFMKKIIMILGVVVFGAAFVQAEVSPQDTLERFFARELTQPSFGLPSENEVDARATLFSPALLSLLRQARAAEAVSVNQTPAGDKPDCFEGNLYSGIYEGASEVVYTSLTMEGSRARAAIELFHVDPQFPKGHRYRTATATAEVLLRQEQGVWLIDDMQFFGKTPRRLTDILRNYIAQYPGAAGSAKP